MAGFDKEIKILMLKGETGGHIETVEKTSTSGIVDTYTMTFDDGNSYTFDVTNGSSISSIAKTSTSGLVDTYTITLTNGDTATFTVTNGQDGDVTSQQLNTAIAGVETQINNITGKVSGSLIGQILNNGRNISLSCVDDETRENGVIFDIDGTNNKISVGKIVNNVLVKNIDLFTMVDDRIPLTSGTQDDAITYAGLYEITPTGLTQQGKSYLISVSNATPSSSGTKYDTRYVENVSYNDRTITNYTVVCLDRANPKLRCIDVEWSSQNNQFNSTDLNFTWKLLIKY